MCDWKTDFSKNISCNGLVIDEGMGEYTVKGKINDYNNNTLIWWAGNPPTYITSYSGSGLPYPNSEIAYENTINKGMVKTDDKGNFQFNVMYPNTYYMGLGTNPVEPCCHIKKCGTDDDQIHTIKLGHGVPFRMLTYPPIKSYDRPRHNVMFYSGRDKLPVRSQEQILRDSGYPLNNIMPKDFWGLTPHHP